MSIYNEMNKKTQDAIQNAFIDLLLKKDFSKITIREIAEYAQVNRGTVYFHYEDKFDLLAKIEEQLIIRLAETIEHLSPSIVLQEARDGVISNFSKSVFQYIESHQKVFKALLSPNSDATFARTLRQFFVDQFLSKFTNEDFSTNKAPIEYVASFAASAFLGIVEHWLTTGTENGDTAAEYYIDTILLIQRLK